MTHTMRVLLLLSGSAYALDPSAQAPRLQRDVGLEDDATGMLRRQAHGQDHAAVEEIHAHARRKVMRTTGDDLLRAQSQVSVSSENTRDK